MYQVSAADAGIDLGPFTLALDTPSTRQHPAATDPETAEAATNLSEQLSHTIKMSDMSQHALPALLTRLRRCKSLVDKELWAIRPLPNLLTEIATNLAQQGSYAQSLAITCLVATSSDPHRYPAPFHPVRLRTLYFAAKLLSHTAADTAAETKALAPQGLAGGIQTTLSEIDQVAMCQMLLMMVVQLAPPGFAQAWDLARDANELLAEISRSCLAATRRSL